MKKLLIVIGIVVILFLVIAYSFDLFNPKPAESVENQANVMPAPKNAFSKQWMAYLNLKDAFITSDTLAVDSAASILKIILENDPIDPTDTLIKPNDQAMLLIQTIIAELEATQMERELEEKRKGFMLVSNAFFDLLKNIGFRGGKVYQQYCPMAFNNSGASWLSNSPDIINPYFGDEMLHCGSLTDSMEIK